MKEKNIMLDSTSLSEEASQPIPERTPAKYPSPARACLVCGATAWSWDAETQAYICAGDMAKHQEHATWHKETFPWLTKTTE